jgi:hypothetical protein
MFYSYAYFPSGVLFVGEVGYMLWNNGNGRRCAVGFFQNVHVVQKNGELEALILNANNVGNSFPCQETRSQGAYDTRKRVLAMGPD